MFGWESPDEGAVVARNLATVALAQFEQGLDHDSITDELIDLWNEFGHPRGAFQFAADVIQEASGNSIVRTVGSEPIRQSLPDMAASTSISERLLAAIDAEELLRALAEEFD